MKKLKWYWHIHHDILLEPLTEPLKNRIDYIKKNKSKKEIPLRLKLIKPVKGKLPVELDKAREAYDKAWEAYHKAWEAYDKAVKARHKVWEVYDKAVKARHKVWEVYHKAREAYVKAWEVYDKAREARNKQIRTLHKKECGCKFKTSIFDDETMKKLKI